MPEIVPEDKSLTSLKGLHLWHAPMSSCSQRVRIVLSETGRPFVSHIVRLEKDEHATDAYQKIHPDGLVPALVEDGRLYIESIDIIARVAGPDSPMTEAASPDLLKMADAAQLDLKLLTFEFLFRSTPQADPEEAAAFQRNHQNTWLKQFRVDFANGFAPARIKAAISRTADGFQTLDKVLSDGRMWLGGAEFSLSDVAWMPNVHRFSLMDWPFGHTPHLQAWFDRVSQRPSYQQALMDWQPEAVPGAFAAYTRKRRDEGTDIRAFGASARTRSD